MRGFLVWYGVLAAAALAVAAAVRWLAWRGRDTLGRPPTALELAYLRGGFALACHAALAGLHRAGAARPGSLSTVVAMGSASEEWPPLMAALHASLRATGSWSQATADPDVRRAGERLRRRLLRHGLLLSTARQRWMKASAVPLSVLAAFGLARLVAAAAGKAPAGEPAATVGLIFAVVGATLAGWLLTEAPTVSLAGRRALRRAAREIRTAPKGGSPTLVMRKVAVGGPRRLQALAPALALVVGVPSYRKYPFPRDLD